MKYSIIVSKGNFSSIKDAAYGEKTISWADFSSDDCRACTECFAALDAKSVLSEKKGFDIEVYDITELPRRKVLSFSLAKSVRRKPLLNTTSNSRRLKGRRSIVFTVQKRILSISSLFTATTEKQLPMV